MTVYCKRTAFNRCVLESVCSQRVRSRSFSALRKFSAVTTLYSCYFSPLVESTMSLSAITARLCAITALCVVLWSSLASDILVIVFRTLIGLLKLFEPLVVLPNCIGYFQGRRAPVLDGRLVPRERAADGRRRFSERQFFGGTLFEFTLCFGRQNVFCSFISRFSGGLLGRRAVRRSAVSSEACVSRFFRQG